MSRHNKVNKDHYVQNGRLTPDEMARERAKQIHVAGGQRKLNERAKQAGPRGGQASTPARSERAEEE
jgi:general stress protein YciG